jgi:hypothetical protein
MSPTPLFAALIGSIPVGATDWPAPVLLKRVAASRELVHEP